MLQRKVRKLIQNKKYLKEDKWLKIMINQHELKFLEVIDRCMKGYKLK